MNILNNIEPNELIRERLPAYAVNYHQPFIVNGTALFSILTRLQIQGAIYVSDPNYHLIKLFKDLQSHYEDFIAAAELIHKEYSRCPLGKTDNKFPNDINEAKVCTQSYYYWIKNTYNNMCKSGHDSILMSVFYMFLNNVASKHPIFSKNTHSFYNKSELWALSLLIQPVIFSCQSFQNSCIYMEPGDFVYIELPENLQSNADFLRACKKKLICKFLLYSPETSMLHRIFPLGFYNVERVASDTSSHTLSVKYNLYIQSLII